MSRKLEFAAERPDASTVVYRLHGTLHGTAEGYAFQDDVRRRFTEGTRQLVVDLADVDHVDSSGIGIFATIVASARNTGARFAIAAMPARVEQVMRVVRLLDVIECGATVEDALARIRR